MKYRTLGNLYSQTYFDIENWDVSSCTTLEDTFVNAEKIETLDLSKWDTSSATNMYMMFYLADAVTVEGTENWNVSNLTTTYAMFYGAKSITELNLAGWQPTKLTNTAYMFSRCSELETIYVSDLWTNAGITSSSSMFAGCGKLVGGAGTKVSGTNHTYARIDTAETPGYLTHINDKPVTETK